MRREKSFGECLGTILDGGYVLLDTVHIGCFMQTLCRAIAATERLSAQQVVKNEHGEEVSKRGWFTTALCSRCQGVNMNWVMQRRLEVNTC